jgi:hypothetical protein
MKYIKELDGHRVTKKWFNINPVKVMGIIGLSYLGIKKIDVPLIGTKKINEKIIKLYLTFINYDVNKCENLLRKYDKDINTLSEDLRVFNYLCFSTDYKRYKAFFQDLFRAKKSIHTSGFLQLCSHRIYEREGYTKELSEILKKSIDYSASNRIDKWRLSGKFFLGVYSQNKSSMFKNFMECLNANRLEIDMDCWRDKIVYIVNWLKFYYPIESEPAIKKIQDLLIGRNDKSYDDLVIPYLTINEPGILNDEIFKSQSSLEILQRIDSIIIK